MNGNVSRAKAFKQLGVIIEEIDVARGYIKGTQEKINQLQKDEVLLYDYLGITATVKAEANKCGTFCSCGNFTQLGENRCCGCGKAFPHTSGR